MNPNPIARHWRLLVAGLALSATAAAHSPPDGARVFFIGIEDGAVVSNPVKVAFGIEGFGIVPAGTTGKERHDGGHHHLLVDVTTLPDMNAPIPQDERHLHFDQGQTEAVLNLAPGPHTLQLLLGDEDHEPQAPPLLSERLSITIIERK